MSNKPISLFDPAIMRQAAIAAFAKMNPLQLWRNPVMFATELAALYVLVLFVRDLMTGGGGAAFAGQIAFWLALTVWFATFAEGVAEGRGKAQAASLRRARSELTARRLVDGKAQPPVAASDLAVGELVEVVAGELIPADGEVVEGVATVDESAITGESAPVIREAGGDRSAVTAGTRVLSDRIAVKVTATQGDTFLDRMIALVEGASRRKTPNEIALGVLLAGLSLIFVMAVATIPAFAAYSGGVVSSVALALVKGGVKERFAELRRMGIRTVMITGDNPLTAAAIAAEAGVDDFLAEAKPEDKLALIREEQAAGRMVAMCGDGTNDAPALAQADVGVAMQAGTPAAREAGNMVDLDSDPTKLIEVVSIGKQLLMTRGSLTTFSIANDVAKYFAIIPALFLAIYPSLQAINVMQLASPNSAILSAIIFNALVIPVLIPLALQGVRWRAAPAGKLLARNLTVYGVGGLIAPFIGIKLIDLVVSGVGLA